MINWSKFKTTSKDYDLISQIAERAMISLDNLLTEKLHTLMDLECALNDVGLNLQKLLTFPDLDFAHDIYGIRRNLNRETGKLSNGFLPRSSS